MTELRTERPRLRAWRDDDAPHLDRLYTDADFMRLAGAASLRHPFATLGYDRVVSITLPQNAASIRVTDRLGIRPYREVWWLEGAAVLDLRAIERAEWARAAPLQSSG